MRRFTGMGMLIVLAFACGPAAGQIAIPVVHTWGDLQNAPKLTVVPSPRVEPGKTPRPVQPPVTFQLGIQGDQGSSYGGVVLYFIAPDSGEIRNTPSERGLFDIEVVGKQTLGLDGGSASYGRPLEMPQGTNFYAIAIPFAEAGDYVVNVVKPFQYNSKPGNIPVVLACAKVHVQDCPDDLWYPFWEVEKSSGGARSDKNADGKYFAIVPLNNPQGGTVVPAPPHPRSYAHLPAADQPLPTVFPAAGSAPTVGLKMVDSTLIINFSPRIEGFFPQDNFLTHWWVNGQSVHLDPVLQRPGQMRVLAANMIITKAIPDGIFGSAVWYTQEVHFELQFRPAWLHVTKGDRVALQLLFCPDSSVSTNGWMAGSWRLEDPMELQPSATFSQISNKIEFTYSGDAAHPQQQ